MQFSLDKYLGLNERALNLQSRRLEVLANNLANTDTPGYQARDLDFKEAMAQQMSAVTAPSSLQTTHTRHIAAQDSGVTAGGVFAELKYRVPNQASIDGNTVDPLLEKAAFMENAIQYQTNLQFLGDKIKHIKAALKGE